MSGQRDREEIKPLILKSKNISGLANYIKSEKCKNIVLMLGAGVSTSAGIPDFRSPKTGLYSNLVRLNLPRPEAVFDISFFRSNPVPFYTLAQELYPGKFRPTPTHSFIRLLHDKGLLLKCFTQNIDTLERRAGLPGHKIIEAHGSFATQRCIDCTAPYDDDLIKVHIKEKTIPRCEGCGGLVKPDIVFFGESLPPEFVSSIPLLSQADLLIVMGTSLTVHPFAMLPEFVDDSCPRVLINLECVGDFARRPGVDDILLLGKCDEMVKRLCKELEWEEELEELWDRTADTFEANENADKGEDEEEKPANAEAAIESEITALTAAIDRSLSLPDDKPLSSSKEEESKTEELEQKASPQSTDTDTTASDTKSTNKEGRL